MPTLELTPQELQSLAGLVDAGVKAIGLRAVREASVILDKLEAAAQLPPPSLNGHAETPAAN